MFVTMKSLLASHKKSYHMGTNDKIITSIKLVIILSIGLCSCTRKPTTIEIQNIQTMTLHVEQSYTNVDKDISLPLKEMLSEIFKVMDVDIISNDELADAVLTINLKGRPRKVTFPEQKRTFYEGAVVNGTVSLAKKGFSLKKAKLYGRKHYYSTTYHSLFSNSDPEKPLLFATKRAFIKMFVDLWGPGALLPIWLTSYTRVLDSANIHEIDEIIKNSDQPEVVPVIMKALQSDSISLRLNSILMLNEFTRLKKFHVKGKSQPRVVEMNLMLRKTVIKDLSPVIKAVNDENRDIRIKAMNILSRFGQEASIALPLLREKLNSDDATIQRTALYSFGMIALPEESIPILISALQSKNEVGMRRALITLGAMGSEAKEAIPEIIPFLYKEPTLAEEVLEKISGKKFGNSVARWQVWWETQ